MYTLYTFIKVEGAPISQINYEEIQQFPQIVKLLKKVARIKYQDCREIYQPLQDYLLQQEQNKGPKLFHKLFKNIVKLLLIQSYNCLQRNQPQTVILNLTYFEKYCYKYLTPEYHLKILLTFAICNWRMQLIDIALDKLKQCKEIIKNNKKQFKPFQNLVQIVQGASYLTLKNYKVSQIIFTKLLNQFTSNLSIQMKSTNDLCIPIVKKMCISLYFLSSINTIKGNTQRAAYQLTKSVQYAKEYLNDQGKLYIQKIQSQHKLSTISFKLTRIQSKIQEITLIKRHKQLYKKSSVPCFKQYQKSQKQISQQKQVINQLKNIFIIRDKSQSYHKMKQSALKFMSKEKKNVNINILRKKINLQTLEGKKMQLQKQLNLKDMNEKIEIQLIQKQQIKKQIKQLQFSQLAKSKKKNILENYLKVFIQTIKYKRNKNLFEFVFGNLFNQAQLKLLTLIKKKRNKRQKIFLKGLVYRKLRHQIQVHTLPYNNVSNYTLLIYQTQRGQGGVSSSKIIDMDQYNRLMVTPFSFLYTVKDDQILTIEEQLQQKNIKQQYLIKKFVKKIKQKYQNKKNRTEITISKRKVSLKYGSQETVLSLILFIKMICCLDHQNKKKYTAIIERIDNNKYKNQRYNIKIRQSIEVHSNYITDQQLLSLIYQYYNAIRIKQQQTIIRIQKNIRRKLSHKKAKIMRQSIKIDVYKIGSYLFTSAKSKSKKILYIENILTKDMAISNNMEINDLQFLRKITEVRLRMQNSKSCQDKMKVIQNYLKIRSFANKLFSRSKSLSFFTDFQTKFRASLCFSKRFEIFLFKGRPTHETIIIRLTVKSFQTFPRPYSIRIFTIKNCSFIIDIQKTVYNKQKIFLEMNVQHLNKFIDITSKKQMKFRQSPAILNDPSIQSVRRQSKIQLSSILPKLQISLNQNNQNIQKFRSVSKKSISNNLGFKSRHKSILKEKDMQKIKRLIDQVNFQQFSSQSSSLSSSDYNQNNNL